MIFRQAIRIQEFHLRRWIYLRSLLALVVVRHQEHQSHRHQQPHCLLLLLLHQQPRSLRWQYHRHLDLLHLRRGYHQLSRRFHPGSKHHRLWTVHPMELHLKPAFLTCKRQPGRWRTERLRQWCWIFCMISSMRLHLELLRGLEAGKGQWVCRSGSHPDGQVRRCSE